MHHGSWFDKGEVQATQVETTEVGAGIGLAVYFVHRSHTSLTGCVEQSEHGLRLTAKDGND
jgi:hypothetical protein